MLVWAACLSAAPTLVLDTTALGPFSIAVGATGPPQTVAVTNSGDGTFNLGVTSSAQWLSATYQAAQTCTSNNCGQIAITLATSALAQGSYTGILTVLDPNAINVPQTITVTVNMGGTVPGSLTLYAPPGGSASASFTTGANARESVTAPWLSVAFSGLGSFQFDVSCMILASAQNLTANAYNGSVTFSGSSFAPDNKTVPVTFNVTTSPIADPGTTSLTFSASAGGSAALATQYVWINNVGQGTLAIADTKVAVDTGSWLSTTQPAGTTLVGIVVNPTGLAAGTHTGTVTVDSNAANSPTVFNVGLTVNGPGSGPTITWPRILNISDFTPNEPVSPGDIVAVFGADMLEGDPITPTTLPLPTQVGAGKTQVLVNGLPAPIFYASYGQINIQIPFETSTAQAAQIQVVRNGITSPVGTVPMAASAPLVLEFGCSFANVCPAPWGQYGLGLLYPDNAFPMPASYPIPNERPAKVGDVIQFFAVGLGQMSPPLVTGAVPPTSPLPTFAQAFSVCFAPAPTVTTEVCTPAQYAGIAPGYVGLYQINVQIPANAPTGDAVYMSITNGPSSTSDYVLLAIQ